MSKKLRHKAWPHSRPQEVTLPGTPLRALSRLHGARVLVHPRTRHKDGDHTDKALSESSEIHKKGFICKGDGSVKQAEAHAVI